MESHRRSATWELKKKSYTWDSRPRTSREESTNQEGFMRRAAESVRKFKKTIRLTREESLQHHVLILKSGAAYDVFLNYIVKDSLELVDPLYRLMKDVGLRVFRDDDELSSGEEISPSLLRVIQNSTIYVIIFSKNYASSSWCLRELAHMVRLRSESDGEKKILPIFYDVQASDVELRTSLYDKDLLELAERFDSHDLGQWRNALIEAAKTKGYAWDGNPESLGRLVKLVVEEVLRRLRENRVSDVINLLDVGGDGVNFLGIWGMGGSGKTALATAVFNELYSRFEGRSFIRDIWEHSRRAGLVTCQAKLLSDVIQSEPPSFNSIDGGRMFIRQILANKKVLLVLDDIDDREQLEALAGARDWFGRGSRIIITTRDRGVLDRDYPIPTYEMGFLNQYELNQRVNKFIRKFNNDLRLQREESDQRHIEMVKSRAC